MKGILKKNQVIITALVIMIAVAGYLNFTQDKLDDIDLASTDTVQTNADGTTAGIGEAAVDGTATDGTNDTNTDKTTTNGTDANAIGATDQINESQNITDDVQLGSITYDADGNEIISSAQEGEDLLDLSAEDLGKDDLVEAGTEGTDLAKGTEVSDEDTTTVGEAVLVSNMIGADYFATAKLEREQNRAKNKETLMEIVENTSISEQQKQDALNSVINMTAIAEKESAAEMLLEAKGFTDVVVRVVEDNVDVIVNAENLTEQQMAQIEDIVKRQTGMSAESIVITPVSVE